MLSERPIVQYGPVLETLETRTFLSAGLTATHRPYGPHSRFHGPAQTLDAGHFTQPEPNFADLRTTGRNPYLILERGHTLVLEGEENGELERLVITVTNQTKTIDGVRTRVVKEVETVDGELVEISWNYLAFERTTKNVFYFGEDVDIYEDGRVVSHEGAWRSGVNGALFGLLMPGDPQPGMTFFQERAPGVAEDEATIINTNFSVTTPAGTFNDCLKVKETSALEPGEVGFKFHAPGIGLIQDGILQLVSVSS